MSADKRWKLRSKCYRAVTTVKHLSEVDGESFLKRRSQLELHSKSIKLSKSRVGSKRGRSEVFFSSQ